VFLLNTDVRKYVTGVVVLGLTIPFIYLSLKMQGFRKIVANIKFLYYIPLDNLF
jgi:hypothetical protein